MTRAALPLALAAALLAAPAAAGAAPTGAVSGVRDPASGLMRLVVLASAGDGLAGAVAALDGVVVARGSFPCAGDPAVCPSAGEAELLVPTTLLADGPHRLTVTVTDAAGTAAVLADRVLTVANAPVPQRTSVTVQVGSGGAGTAPSAGSGGPPPGVRTCDRPRLRVHAAWREPELRGLRLVLQAGRRHRFAGRVTCVGEDGRGPAAAGTLIRLTQRRDGAVLRRRTLRTDANGRFAVRVRARTRRTLVFSLRSGGRTTASVRLPVVVVPLEAPA